ncbi:hypothetical protein Cch01nite_29280 [Cellulomonas chitinilytica]|uniref:DUF3048 domain-containing protein n=1 Tax=Cellulomonas chitinilytica TaxID=398759 RepID=A0A919P6E6_9CELL|nr:DUF3048 domain-containing protein [Cellulomonas chitinilytica]GIG22204.1 hypothetical protein Cch01nite_29280 [Cellulomonas chitinilytica]
MPSAPTGASARLLVAALTSAAVLALAACGGEASAQPTVPAPVTEAPVIEAAKAAPPTPVVPPRWPLTGVAAAGEVPVRPALAVKIENSGEARPQTGLEQADVVWEEVVEGGITRFVAVFHSQVPAEIGPIRSVRPMDPAIASPLHGLIAFSGGQPGFVQALSASGLQILSQDKGAAGFFRKKGVAPAPHNVYGTPETMWGQADGAHSAAPPTQFTVARQAGQATATLSGTPATSVDITMSGYSHPQWAWDAASGTWLRSEGAKPATARSGARLAATNVVALSVRLVNSGTTDPAGNPVPETVLDGSGDGLVATGGKTVAVRWSKAVQDAPVVLTTVGGAPVSLAAGTTWVELVPGSSGSVTPR